MGQYAGSDIVLESNSLLRAVFFIPKNKERQVTVMRQAVTTMQYVFAGIGGFMGWFLGGLDGFLYALLMFVVIDYATGLMAAFVQKKVSSEVGFKGICKKVAIFCLVGIGHVLDTQVIQNGSVLRTAVIFFYLSNEGISIIENVALPVQTVPDMSSPHVRQAVREESVPPSPRQSPFSLARSIRTLHPVRQVLIR